MNRKEPPDGMWLALTLRTPQPPRGILEPVAFAVGFQDVDPERLEN